MDESEAAPFEHMAVTNDGHHVSVRYYVDPAPVHIVDPDTDQALCGFDTSGPDWMTATTAISGCCLDCIMVYRQRQLAEKIERWQAGEAIQPLEPNLWGIRQTPDREDG